VSSLLGHGANNQTVSIRDLDGGSISRAHDARLINSAASTSCCCTDCVLSGDYEIELVLVLDKATLANAESYADTGCMHKTDHWMQPYLTPFFQRLIPLETVELSIPLPTTHSHRTVLDTVRLCSRQHHCVLISD